MKQSSKKADLLLLGILFLAGAVIGIVLLMNSHRGARVEIRVEGETVETFSLAEDRAYTITGKDGGTNTLIIEDGEAWLSDATCPDQLCVRMGHIFRDGQSVICLPNQVVVAVVDDTAEGETAEVDVIAGGKQ